MKWTESQVKGHPSKNIKWDLKCILEGKNNKEIKEHDFSQK